MARLERTDMKTGAPKLNAEKPDKEWLGTPNGPRGQLANEKPKGATMPYEQRPES